MKMIQNRSLRVKWFLILVGLTLVISLAVQLFSPERPFFLLINNFRVTLDRLLYAGMSYLAYRECPSEMRPLFAWFCFGWIFYALGQIIQDGQALTGITSFHLIIDLLFLCLPICLIGGLLQTLLRKLSTAMRLAAALDIISVELMSLTLTLALYLSTDRSIRQWAAVITILNLTLYLLTIGVLCLTILFKKLFLNRGTKLMLGGLGMLILCWLIQNLRFLTGKDIEAGYLRYFSMSGVVALLLGTTFSQEAHPRNLLNVNRAWRLQRLLPLLFVIVSGLVLIFAQYQVNSTTHRLVMFGALTLVILAIIRQSLLLFEREATLQIQRKVRQQESHLKTLLGYSNDFSFQMSVESNNRLHYRSISQGFEKLTKIEIKNILGKAPHEFFPPSTADEITAHCHNCLNTGKPIRYEQFLTMPHNVFWFDTMLIPMKDPQGRVEQLIGISRNITASKNNLETIKRTNLELEATVQHRSKELVTAYREMEMFSYSVSHDLRTPLRGVNGFCRAFREDYEPLLDQKAKTYLERIHKASEHMGHIIDDLLQLSRVSRVPLEARSVNLSQLVQTIVENLKKIDPHRKINLKTPLLLEAWVDPKLIDIAMRALLSNAWKFTSLHPEAEIEFGLQDQGEEMVFFLRDDGAGFEQEYAHKLFKPFQRLHDQIEFEGIGIGLAIVARIIERHHGKIWATGQLEQGATFYFTLGPSIEKTALTS